ncbi:MAG: tetratricopeptide repeat protein [Pseudomonadota bacterium]
MLNRFSRLAITTALALTAASLPATLSAEGNAGAYLAGRQAGIDNDYSAAAQYFSRALIRDTQNPALIENAASAYLSMGDLDRAVPLATRLTEMEVESQIAGLIAYADLSRQGDWQAIIDSLDAGRSVGPLYDGLLRAWALVGLGRMGDALEQFSAVENARGTQAFGLYHRALALASVGDFEGANAIFSGEEGTQLRLTPRGTVAHIQVLGQLQQIDTAVERVAAAQRGRLDPFLSNLGDRLTAGEDVPFDVVTSATDGIAEMHFSIANALTGEASDGFTLVYARLATILRPDHVEGLLLTADLLERLERYGMATEVYDQVARDHPYFYIAEMGRAEALKQADQTEAAIEVLTQLGETHSDLPLVHVALGDTLRRLERFEEAVPAYDRAIALIDDPQPSHWSLYFSRGIVHERTENWPPAEADFRKALELQPDQPQVLNYLGYSFVEMQINLDEALDMIERAVAGEPNSGYITDSLGWVLYRLGRFEEAVGHMERAVELLPIDPIINDHLGDVYWAVGRYREAEFQWHRALSFEPEEDDAERIRRKLEVGLDVVLDEEGAPPLQVANDDG